MAEMKKKMAELKKKAKGVSDDTQNETEEKVTELKDVASFKTGSEEERKKLNSVETDIV
jgi:hypothetical protein